MISRGGFTGLMALVAAGCGSSSGHYYLQTGTAALDEQSTSKNCWDNNKVSHGASALAPSDPNAPAAANVAVAAAGGLVSGLEKGRRRVANHADCMAQRGFIKIPLTEAEQQQLQSMTESEREKQLQRWASGAEKSRNVP